jgi:hypothetical protein
VVAVWPHPLQGNTAVLEPHMAVWVGLVAVQPADVLPLTVAAVLGHTEETGLPTAVGRGKGDRQPDAGEQELVAEPALRL